jgi:hypothetical protein
VRRVRGPVLLAPRHGGASPDPGAPEAAEARILERQAEKKRLAFLHEDPDPEVTAHLKEVGKRMRKEGRWVVKKNERAGFS